MKMKRVSQMLKGRIIVGACAVLTAAAVIGGAFTYNEASMGKVPELVSYVDNWEGETVISDEEVPLAEAPKTTSKTTTKTSTKSVKMSKAAAKTYTKRLPATTKTSTKTASSSTKTVKRVTTVKTQITEKYTKKSKIKKVTTKVTTTVKTTEISGNAVTTGNTPKKASISQIAPAADAKVLNAYQTLGFTVTIDPQVSYSGYFDAKSQSITLKENDDDIYHELGHFLAFVAGNVDTKAAFTAVYNQEKASYTGSNESYVLQNSSEYFAESYRDYVLSPAALKQSRPKTYDAIASALSRVTDSQIKKLKAAYASVWNS